MLRSGKGYGVSVRYAGQAGLSRNRFSKRDVGHNFDVFDIIFMTQVKVSHKSLSRNSGPRCLIVIT